MAKSLNKKTGAKQNNLGITTLFKNTLKTNKTVEINFNARENKTKQAWIISSLIGIPLILLTGLLINFFVYYPNSKTNNVVNGAFHISGNGIMPFIVVIVLSAIISVFLIFLLMSLKKSLVFDNQKQEWTLASIGAIGMFFDTIGVGSYAVVIGLTKATKTIDDDKKIPGNLTVGLVLPQLGESAILIGAFTVDWITLVTMVAAAIIGGIVGAWLANKINSQILRLIIGSLMFVFAILMILVHPQVSVIKTIASLGTTGYTHVGGFESWRLAIGIIIYFVLGICSSLGLGMYAPSMALLTLLGMDTTTILAIMSLAASTPMPLAAIKFIKDKNFNARDALIFNLAGMCGVLISFLVFFVGLQNGAGMDKQTFGNVIRWIAIPVVFYCSGLMLFDFAKDYRKTGWK